VASWIWPMDCVLLTTIFHAKLLVKGNLSIIILIKIIAAGKCCYKDIKNNSIKIKAQPRNQILVIWV